ncbi:signal protein PDZ [Emticicia sp. CRIBPO]|uniref:aspartyl protease family protein n=1 Tax=Emticicia sp. CRIBPO TaxID=2683258 RepID=UPI001411BE4C|nr:aspartyl protease family protein [Emticicia sp. CRIBPO]NBA84677.1 signal protein PDZ [Emticicia sp. CRIBPO]
MNPYLKIFVVSVTLTVTCLLSSSGQQVPKRNPVQDSFGFNFKNKRQKTAKFPFDLFSNLIVVKVKIDNSDTLNFILDTGVSSIIITDPVIAEKMNLKYVRQVKISGAGEGDALTAGVSINHTVEMGDIKAFKQNLVVLDEDILRLSEYMGIPVHGIFGHDLFERFVITMDFGSKNLFFYEPAKFKFNSKMGEKYPIVVTQSKPYMDAIGMVQNDKDVPLRLVIDTGAGHALLLNTNTNSTEHSAVQLPDKVIRANLGRGLNGSINGHIGRVNKVTMGKYHFNDVLASFPDSISFSMKFQSTDDNRQGSVGGEFLRRFKVTMNYHLGYIAFKPLKNKFNESFEHDMSGIEVRAKGDGLKTYMITYVVPGSQAQMAGIMEGDEIIFLNNVNTKDLTINDIFKILSKKEGKEIEMFLRRNGQLKFAYFRLKRVI